MVACISQRLPEEFASLSVSQRIALMNGCEGERNSRLTQVYGRISKKSKAKMAESSSNGHYYSQVPVELDHSQTAKLSRSQSAVSCRRQKLIRRPSVAPPEPPKVVLPKTTDHCWYHEHLDRQTAVEKLINLAKNGSFLIRKHSGGHPTVPYTLSLFHRGKVYHLEIRKSQNGQFAIGKPSAGGEQLQFKTIPELINFHSQLPLSLVSRKPNQTDGKKITCCTLLTEWVKP